MKKEIVIKMGIHAHKILEINREESFKMSGNELWTQMILQTHEDVYLGPSLDGILVLDAFCLLELEKTFNELKIGWNRKEVKDVSGILEEIIHDINISDKGIVKYYCY